MRDGFFDVNYRFRVPILDSQDALVVAIPPHREELDKSRGAYIRPRLGTIQIGPFTRLQAHQTVLTDQG